MANQPSFKLTLVGENGVGKTSLIKRYIGNGFDASEPSTIGCTSFPHEVPLESGPVTLSIWDTAGSERFRSIAPQYYRGSHGFVIVYDLSQPTSVECLRYWIEELSSTVDTAGDKPTVPILLAGNKSDLETDGNAWQDARQFAENYGIAHHCKASARSGDNVDEVFEALIPEMVEYAEKVAFRSVDPRWVEASSPSSGCC
jgi:small GTP-binding protein